MRFIRPLICPTAQMETKHVAKESRALAILREQGNPEQSLQQQIDAVERTFEDASALKADDLRHPSDPSLRCVSLLPVSTLRTGRMLRELASHGIIVAGAS